MTTQPQSIAGLFAAEESGLLRYALGLVGRRMVAEEIVQDAFLRLHQSWSEIENPRGWVYRCVRNLALNHLRDFPAEAELKEGTVASEDTLPADLLGRNEAIGLMRLLLAELPDEDRTLLLLKYHDGLKYDEIARRTGLNVGNVGYRLHHLLKALAEGMRHAGVDGSQG